MPESGHCDSVVWAPAQERRYCSVQKRGDKSHVSKYKVFGVYSINQTVGCRKMSINRAIAASIAVAAAQHLLSPFF
jgi:hypothetical protein